jgi:Cu+-exporting ATPase
MNNTENINRNKLEENAIDPVCGMEVSAPSDERKFEYEGKTHFFCSAGCFRKFKNDPEKYLGETEKPQKAASLSDSYTCPMHPEVLQDHPGECPICGMALEPK